MRTQFAPVRAISILTKSCPAPALLDHDHAGVGETEMVTDLVDQHVADNAFHRLAVPVGVTEDGDTVEKDPVGQTYGIPYAFGPQSHAMIQPE